MKRHGSITLILIIFSVTSCTQSTPENRVQPQSVLLQKNPLPLSVLPNQYTCTHLDCNKTFVNGEILRRHKYTHKLDIATVLAQFQSDIVHTRPLIQQAPPSSSYICTYCNKAFANKGALKRHKSIHKNPKSHQCTYCSKKFKYKSNLTRHMVIHTNPESLTCSQCNKSFKHKYTLKNHMIIHTNPDALTCSQCNKRFAYERDLNRHILTHTITPKRYRCTHCNKKFPRKSNLKAHMKTHRQQPQP